MSDSSSFHSHLPSKITIENLLLKCFHYVNAYIGHTEIKIIGVSKLRIFKCKVFLKPSARSVNLGQLLSFSVSRVPHL